MDKITEEFMKIDPKFGKPFVSKEYLMRQILSDIDFQKWKRTELRIKKLERLLCQKTQ